MWWCYKMSKDAIFTTEMLDPSVQESADFIRCEAEFAHFFEQHGVAEVRDVGLVPMHDVIWPFQRQFVRILQREPRVLVLKARQIGISTILMHFAYWLCRFGAPNSQRILILSKSKDDAAHLLGMVPNINLEQPESIQVEPEAEGQHHFEFPNGNKIKCLAATEGGGRGFAATAVFLDEHAFHRYPEKNWNAVKPTLEGEGHFVICSTGNGIGNMFHDLWLKAKERANNFLPVFIPWSAPLHRDPEWLENERRESPLPDDEFLQEYPSSDNEAFVTTGNCPFDVEWVQDQIKRAETKTVEIPAAAEGRVQIFQRPEKGERYAAGIDCAQGVNRQGTSDRTSVKVIDTHGRHVASWDGKRELTDALPEIEDLLRLYREPFLCVERNGPGVGFITALWQTGYRNFYRFQQSHIMPQAKRDPRPRIGIQMNAVTKPIAVRMLIEWISGHGLYSSDVGMWKEFLTFVQKGPTRWEAQGKYKDDQVVSMMWAKWALQHLPAPARKLKKKKIRWV